MTDANSNLTPGMIVRCPAWPEWGEGQVQSVVGRKITVNFREKGKVVLDGSEVSLVIVRL